MIQDIEDFIKQTEESLEKVVEYLVSEFNKIRAGKASPSMIDGIMVDYYGNQTPLQQVANISTPDARTLSIQPWEKNMLSVIEKALFEANLGLTPMNDGEIIRLIIPQMSEERRTTMVKQAKQVSEDAKISVRSNRHKMIDFIKRAVKDGFPEDAGKRKEEEIQKLIDSYVAKIEKVFEAKEKDIMTV